MATDDFAQNENSWKKDARPRNYTSDIEDDLVLIRKSAAGDKAAFHALVDRHTQRMFALAVSLVGNHADAEDVLQEAFVGIFRGVGKFEARASVKTWMMRILVIQVAKWRRDRKGRAEQPIETAMSRPSTDSAAASVGNRIDLHAAIARLSASHREVIVLREFEELSYEEIAAVLGVPRGTVESRLHRAREELREILKDHRS